MQSMTQQSPLSAMQRDNLQETRNKPSQCSRPMANGPFHCQIQFPEGSMILRNDEERIITETATTTASFRNAASTDPRVLKNDLPLRISKTEVTVKLRTTAIGGNTLKLA